MNTRSFVIFALLMALAPYAVATTISYKTINVTGNIWRYEYSLINDSLSDPIDEFTIYFDRNSFSNLNVDSSPLDWDSIVIQPDFGIPSDGFFDALALGPGLAPSATVAGFIVSFEFLGGGTPGSQRFEIIDPRNFDILDSGLTVATTAPPPPPHAVPEPNSIALLAFAFFALLARRYKKIGL